MLHFPCFHEAETFNVWMHIFNCYIPLWRPLLNLSEIDCVYTWHYWDCILLLISVWTVGAEAYGSSQWEALTSLIPWTDTRIQEPQWGEYDWGFFFWMGRNEDRIQIRNTLCLTLNRVASIDKVVLTYNTPNCYFVVYSVGLHVHCRDIL